MENKPLIIFKKERDLGAIITDTFKFIRYNWKAYFGMLLKIVGPVLIVTIITVIGLLLSFGDMFQNLQEQQVPDNPMSIFSSVLPWYGAMLILIIVLYSLMSMATLFFIKYYIDTNGESSFEYVKTNVLNQFWKYLGLGTLVVLSIIVGLLFCFIPGYYLMVVLSLAAPIMIFRDMSISDAYSYSFTLIKGQWWNTFGVIIVIGLLIGVLGSVFAVPAFIYQIIRMVTLTNDDPTAIFAIYKDPIYIALNVLSYSFQFTLYSVTMIAGVFIYYDLNEQKNLTGTIEKIDNLGV